VTRQLFLAAALACAASIASAEPVTTIRNNGSSANRVDLVILGDGYTAGEMGKYATDVENAVNGFFAVSPHSEYKNYFNVHRIDVISAESGADHTTPSVVLKNTAFDSYYDCAGIDRLICANTTKVNNVLTASIPAANARDMVLLLVNDPVYGGSGGAIAIASTHTAAVELVLHETGHSFGLLADEYDYSPPPCNTSVEPSEANVTIQTVRANIKWKLWIDAGTPIPTTSTAPGVPGLYQGGRYCVTGMYRPTYDSKMRTLNVPFYQINSEQLVKRVYNYVSPIDGTSPAASSLTIPRSSSQLFTVNRPSPTTHSLAIEWRFDGIVVGTGNSYTVNGVGVPGVHSLQLKVSDTTSLVRNDPSNVLIATRTWSVTLQGVSGYKNSTYDSDSKSDLAVYRGSTGEWFLRNSASGYAVGAGNWYFQWGLSGDKPVPGDYDGDGKTDLAVYRPSTGEWLLRLSGQNYTVGAGNWYFQWGLNGDLPYPNDYDGDGKTDLAVYRPSTGEWFLRLSGQNYTVGAGNWYFQWGLSGDQAVPADYDGDGKTDLAVYRPTSGEWFLRLSGQNYTVGAGNWYFQWGLSGDMPLTGDFDGDSKTDLAIYRPVNGLWLIRYSSLSYVVGAGNWQLQWGLSGDIPRIADFDGDGKAEVTVYRPSTGEWLIRYSSLGYTVGAGSWYFQWGLGGDTSLPQ
jgi:hypothetical protein